MTTTTAQRGHNASSLDTPPRAADPDAISLEALEDRWDGAISSDMPDSSERWLRLQECLEDLVYVVSRRVGDAAWEGIQQRGEGDLHVITDECWEQLHSTIVRRVHELGVAS